MDVVEAIVYLVIVSWCALIMIVIGIVQLKSRRPVGFWSGIAPPPEEKITDVKAYNRKHGWMWIIYGISMPGSFLVMLPFGSGLAAVLVNCAVMCGGIIVMILYHLHLEKMYVKK